jgi:hypothetical protein
MRPKGRGVVAMRSKHWYTDHVEIQRVLGVRWREVVDLASDAANDLLDAERHFYRLASEAFEAGRRLFPS